MVIIVLERTNADHRIRKVCILINLNICNKRLSSTQKHYFDSVVRSRTISSSLELNQLDIIVELKGSLRITLARQKVDNKRVLNRKDRVILKILIIAVEDLRRQGTVVIIGSLNKPLALLSRFNIKRTPRPTYNNVNVSRAERMTVHQIK
jgi:hypothetical protein